LSIVTEACSKAVNTSPAYTLRNNAEESPAEFACPVLVIVKTGAEVFVTDILFS
jgi:hypothetical protein